MHADMLNRGCLPKYVGTFQVREGHLWFSSRFGLIGRKDFTFYVWTDVAPEHAHSYLLEAQLVRISGPCFTVRLSMLQMVRSKTKCNNLGRSCCKGNIFTQLSLEKRTMIHHNWRGASSLLHRRGVESIRHRCYLANFVETARFPVRIVASTSSGGRRLPCRCGPDVRPGLYGRASHTTFGPPPCGTRAPVT